MPVCARETFGADSSAAELNTMPSTRNPASGDKNLKDLRIAALSRRAVLKSLVILATSNCSGPMEKAYNSIAYAFTEGDGTPITRNRINNIPYATMSAKVGDGPRALIVLGRTDGANLHWFGADRTVLVTRHGRLVRTAGLPFNLKSTRLLGDEPLTTLGRRRDTVPPYNREVDLAPPNRYGVIIEAAVEEIGPETIEISELSFETIAYRENCRARDIDWKFSNLYWVSPSNRLVWKSVQHPHPELPAFELQLLKPAIV